MIGTLEIATIRELFPNEELYYIRIAEREFVFKAITPKEYFTIKEISKSAYDEEDLITQTSLVYPSTYNVLQGEAGIPKTLSEIVLKISLLHTTSRSNIIDRFLNYTQELESDIDAQIPVVVKMAFPEFTFEQIEDWTVDIKLKNFARALLALKLKGVTGIDGFKIDEPEEVPILTLEEEEKQLEEQGIDPVIALYDKYKPRNTVIEFPFITGNKWDNEEINHAVKQQIYRSIKR